MMLPVESGTAVQGAMRGAGDGGGGGGSVVAEAFFLGGIVVVVEGGNGRAVRSAYNVKGGAAGSGASAVWNDA